MTIGFPKPRAPQLERHDARGRLARTLENLRVLIWLRDGHKCRCCGRRVKVGAVLCEGRLEVAHVVPRSLAAERITDPTNLLVLCGLCHLKVHAHELEMLGTNEATVTFHVIKPAGC